MRKIAIVACGLALLGASWSKLSGPAEGADRFVDTFRWQLPFGFQEITLSRDGSAQYRMAAPDDNDVLVIEVADGGYRVVGDTAFVGLKAMRPEGTPEQPDIEATDDSLFMILRNDNLIYANFPLGNAPVFVRK
jgi:hypothetical protein